MARSTRRNFWDNARRVRNAQKPDYWEDWEREWEPRVVATDEAKSVTKSVQFTQGKPTAKDARRRLKLYGLTGNKLSDTVRKIMKGEILMAWVEQDLFTEKLKSSGFMPIFPETRSADGTMTIFFERRSPDGALLETASITFRKKADITFHDVD